MSRREWTNLSDQTRGKEKVERAARQSRGSAEAGVGEYANFAAEGNQVANVSIAKAPAPRAAAGTVAEAQSGDAPCAEQEEDATRVRAQKAEKTNDWIRRQLGELENLRRQLHEERSARWELEKRLEDPELQNARAELIRGIVELVPRAIAEAKKGRPALLRLISRAVGLRKSGQPPSRG